MSLHILRINFSTPRTGFIIQTPGASKVLFTRLCFYTHQSISAMSTFHLSCQPCIHSLPVRHHCFISQKLDPATQPYFRRNQPLMRADHKHMSPQILKLIRICASALIQITPMYAVKHSRITGNICPLASEETVHIHIRTHICRIPQQLGKHWADQRFSIKQDSLFRIIPGDVSIRSLRLTIHAKNFPDNPPLFRLLHQLLGMDPIHYDFLQPITIRCLSSHMKSFLASGIISITDTLLDRLPL